jgi:glucuronyl esterase-like protein
MKKQWFSVGASLAFACAAVAPACSSQGADEAVNDDSNGNGAPGDGAGSAETPSGMEGDGAGVLPGTEPAPGATGLSGSGESGVGSGVGGLEGAGSAPGSSGGDPAPLRPTYDHGATVENTGADCAVATLPAAGQLPRIDKLPDPFLKLDGTRLTQTSEWRCRRQELLKQAEQYIYGEKPAKPELVSGSVSTDTVTVNVQEGGTSISFNAEVVLPAQGTGPFPALINLGARNAGGITLGESFILEQGVAIIFYNHYDLGQEGQPEASRGLPNPGLFYDIYGGDHSAGLLMAWAWGASRLLDVLQESGADIIDPNRVGVTGCSRNGKGAFTVGVFDERIALTIPQETSTGGLPAYRIVDVTNGAERTNWNYFGLNWLSDNFGPFVENAAELPIDSHELVGMVAPRGLLVLDNPHVAQFAASSAHTAVLAGAEVYGALGALGNLSYISDIVNDVHCASGKPEYAQPITQSISRFLKHEGEGAGTIRAGATGTGDLAEWRDWQTPTLQSESSD